MRWLSGVAAVVVITACASTTRKPILDEYPAGITGRTTVVYYDVKGRTYEEVRAEMRRLGPKIGGRTFFGEARSPMQWRWRLEQDGASYCSIRDVTVSVNAQITLPRWTPPADADPALVKEWKRFLTALEEHEAGHKNISARAARDIVRRLSGYSDLCSMINSRANDLARTITDRARVDQSAFDADTRHGINQGALFSVPAVRDSAA